MEYHQIGDQWTMAFGKVIDGYSVYSIDGKFIGSTTEVLTGNGTFPVDRRWTTQDEPIRIVTSMKDHPDLNHAVFHIHRSVFYISEMKCTIYSTHDGAFLGIYLWFEQVDNLSVKLQEALQVCGSRWPTVEIALTSYLEKIVNAATSFHTTMNKSEMNPEIFLQKKGQKRRKTSRSEIH